MLLKFSVIVACFFQVQFVSAQSNYVEVTVQDTVLLQPDIFLFRISANIDQSAIPVDTAAARLRNYFITRGELLRERAKQQLEELQNKIIALGYTVLPFTMNEVLAPNNYSSISLQVKVVSLDSLKAFFSFIKNEKNISNNLVSATASKEDAANDRLTKKLFAKTRSRADVLAKMSGKQIMSISTVSEMRLYNSSNFSAGFNNNPSLNAPVINIDGKQVSFSYPLQNSLTVRYLWR